MLISHSNFIRSYELESFDWRLRCCGRTLDLSDVAVVRLDNPSLDRNPEAGWPIPRKEYAAFIEGMMAAGAQVVALDLLFVFPDKNGAENDRRLAETLERYRDRVVLGMTFSIHEEDNPDYIWGTPGREIVPYVAAEEYFPLEPFTRSARAGHLTVVPDLDGIVRCLPLTIQYQGHDTPALSLAAAMAFHGIPADRFATQNGSLSAGSGASRIRIPVDDRGCLIPGALYRGHEEGPRYAFSEVMRAIEDESHMLEGASLESAFGGKIVLAGMGEIVEDRAATPWGANTEGVDIHAAFIETILTGSAAGRLPLSGEVLLVFLLAAGVGICAVHLSLTRALVVTMASVAGYLAVTVAALSLSRAILPMMGPMVGIAFSSVPILYRRVALGEKWRTAEEAEIRKATAIQQMLLPRGQPDIEGVDLHGSLMACLEVAGDSYDYFALGSDRLALSVGDVVGKGLPAAMLMSNIQGRVRTEAGHLKDPAEIMTAVNHACALVLEPTSYATMAFAVLNVPERTLTYSLAGHCLPLIVRSGGSTEWLRAGGPPIGMLGQATYGEERSVLGEGDAVVFYTDGITEAADPSGEFYDEARLEEVLRAGVGLDARAMADRVLRDVDEFTRGAPATDDRTLLIVRLI